MSKGKIANFRNKRFFEIIFGLENDESYSNAKEYDENIQQSFSKSIVVISNAKFIPKCFKKNDF